MTINDKTIKIFTEGEQVVEHAALCGQYKSFLRNNILIMEWSLE